MIGSDSNRNTYTIITFLTTNLKRTYVNSPGMAVMAKDPRVIIWTSTISGCQGWGFDS